MGFLRRFHLTIYAWFLRYYRTKEIQAVFKTTHAQELRETPIGQWPEVKARQRQELLGIQAGKLDVVDRKSWQWPFLPASVQRLSVPIAKSTPYNLRRMSRTPVPRRAYNLIKGALISQNWDVVPIDGVDPLEDVEEQKERQKIARKCFNHPNNQDSFQSFLESSIEDILTLGAFATELRFTIDPDRPVKMWPVNIESIRLFASWAEDTPDMPHYAQMTGLKGERGAVLFYDDEMMYVKDNPSTDNPFGLGKMEVAFQSVNDFLGVQRMAGMAGSDQVHKTWLWWEQPQTDAGYQIVRRHIQNEMEGQAKISIIGGMKKPEVVEVTPVTEGDLLLNWQELLIRMIANAFELSAMSLGVEHDVNRAVGTVLDDKDFRSAIVPLAKRIQEAYTRRVLHDKLGWYDLEFRFLNLDDPDLETKMDMCSKMFSMNAATPNEIRKSLGWAPSTSPFADLNQFEMMLVNQQAAAVLQDEAAQNNLDRQKQMMEDQAQQQQQVQEPPQEDPENDPNHPDDSQDQEVAENSSTGPETGKKPTSLPDSSTSQGPNDQPKSPKPLSLPKFPISGTVFTAAKIAQMPVDKLNNLWNSGVLPRRASRLLRAMENQDPDILLQMTEQVKEFFKQKLEEEQQGKEDTKPLSSKVWKRWEKELKIKFTRDNKRTNDFGQWLYKNGQKVGRPGGGSSQKNKVGKPGDINPIKRD